MSAADLACVPRALHCRRRQIDAASVDPNRLFAACPDEPGFLWRGGENELLAATGVAYALESEGAERFRVAATEFTELGGERPLLLGGFAFDGEPVKDQHWNSFAPLSFHVPRVAVIIRGDVATLFAASMESPQDAEAALDEGEAWLAEPVAAAEQGGASLDLRVRSYASDEEWRESVCAALEEISGGRLQKIVLARALEVTTGAPVDLAALLAQLGRTHPQASIFAVRRGATTFVGASPERLARVEGGALYTGAVAGTARRGDGYDEEAAAAADLHASSKERHEHALVVADLRSRLAGTCSGIETATEPETIAAGPVQHLSTPIRATMRDGATILDVIDALHPTPALGGLPREEVRGALARHEGLARGWYGGGVGWIDGDEGEITVAIRTALVRDRMAVLYAGAGIVAGSDPDNELDETRLKLRTMLEALLEI